MMKDDYASAGGSLKLKGVKDAKIDKKRKKKKQPKADGNVEDSGRANSAEASGDRPASDREPTRDNVDEDNEIDAKGSEIERSERSVDGKTQAERRYEEMRRKRVSVLCY